eukprot:Skav219074  [mRNA]  locus=scaffold1777:59216:61748:- [translate_table: standard]
MFLCSGELRLAIGQISLCIPDLHSSETARNRSWLAMLGCREKVTRQRIDPEKNGMIEDVLIYSLDRETSKWYVFDNEDLFLRKELKTYFGNFTLFQSVSLSALFGEMSWSAVKGAMDAAERAGLLSEEASRFVHSQEHMEQKAEDHIHDIHTSAELKQLESIEDSAFRLHSVLLFFLEALEYLEEHVKISAVEVLAVLCDLKLVEVPDDIWKQILDSDAAQGSGG